MEPAAATSVAATSGSVTDEPASDGTAAEGGATDHRRFEFDDTGFTVYMAAGGGGGTPQENSVGLRVQGRPGCGKGPGAWGEQAALGAGKWLLELPRPVGLWGSWGRN